MLSSKQKEFCKLVVSGLSYKDAYIKAYNSKGCTQNAYNEGSKLIARDDIQEEIKRLSKPLEQAAQTTAITERQKKRDWLWNMINNPNTKDSDRLTAMNILNKMDSEYINNSNVDINIDSMDSIDTSLLEKIAEKQL